MQALLKTAALAATLGFAAVGAASAATYTYGPGIYTGTYTLAGGTSYSIDLDGSITAHYSIYSTSLGFNTGMLASDYAGVYSGSDTDVSYFFVVEGTGTVTVTLDTPSDQTPVVPLPASLPLLAGALGAVGYVSRRRKAA